MSGPAAYCEAIFELAEDEIDTVRIRVAERLGVSRAAVSEMVQRLVEMELVRLEGTSIRLTGSGRELAEQSVRRHRLAERLLVDVLGLGWAEAHEIAGTWQHVINDRTEAAIDRVLGSPTTCPHGNPIPGSTPDGARTAGLDPMAVGQMAVGSVGTVSRVTEQLEVQPGMLASLEHAGLVPGTRVEVLSIGHDGSLAVRASRGVLALSSATAARILVTPGDLGQISDAVARGRH
ncbi:MAG: metal-dependent transcriptional regulator [Actinomycetota bacterium]|nr:metal-dependent transcriptional regulator [Actinomycetota bacterium]